jgi:1,4-alpha-glucan branching enzyme
LNKLYLAEPALWEGDYDVNGFYWIDCSDHASSVIAFVRQDPQHRNELAVILNLTPVPRYRYRLGLPRPGKWREVLNSDAAIYGGRNVGNLGGVLADDYKCHRQPWSAQFTLPPLSIIAFQPDRRQD